MGAWIPAYNREGLAVRYGSHVWCQWVFVSVTYKGRAFVMDGAYNVDTGVWALMAFAEGYGGPSRTDRGPESERPIVTHWQHKK